jgi:hypothetical protein
MERETPRRIDRAPTEYVRFSTSIFTCLQKRNQEAQRFSSRAHYQTLPSSPLPRRSIQTHPVYGADKPGVKRRWGRPRCSEVGGSVRPRLPAACGCLRRTRRGQDSAVVTQPVNGSRRQSHPQRHRNLAATLTATRELGRAPAPVARPADPDGAESSRSLPARRWLPTATSDRRKQATHVRIGRR